MTEQDAPPKVVLPKADSAPHPNNKTRRQIMRSIAMGGAVVGASLFGFFPVLRKWTPRLRPPGAIDETDFLAACIKCGQCVQVCPVKAIELGDLDEGFGVGVPFIDPRAQACDFSAICAASARPRRRTRSGTTPRPGGTAENKQSQKATTCGPELKGRL